MRGLLLVLLLAGCAPATQGVGCARLTDWSEADQQALAAEYRSAAPLVRRAIDDLAYMRNQARACQGISAVSPPRGS